MIPKKIHYCWFGGNPLPEMAVKCIASWKKYCPDYEIIEWNENNFDVTCCNYVREAFEVKKWAFITDYVRLKVMVEFGGIYMDTDVEVIKSLDIFLHERAFSGFESETAIPTGIMACEKNFPLFQEMLKEYEQRCFILPDGTFDITTNVVYITKACLKKGLRLNNTYQVLDGFALYPKEFFCPKSLDTGEINCTENTYTIHHFSASWNNKNQKKIAMIERKLTMKFGKEKMHKLFQSKVWIFFRYFYSFGFLKTMKRIRNYKK